MGGGGGDGLALISEGTVGRQASSWLDQVTHVQCMYFRRTRSYLPTYVPICMYACRLTSSVTRLCVLASMLALCSGQLKGPTINDRWSAGQCHIAVTLNQCPTHLRSWAPSWRTLWSVSTWKYVRIEGTQKYQRRFVVEWCYQLFFDHQPPALPQLHAYTCDDIYTVCTC